MPVPYVRAIAALLIAIALLVLGSALTYRHLSTKLATRDAQLSVAAKQLQSLQAARKRDQALLARRASANAAAAREAALLRTRLGEALLAQRAWAEQPVPEDVQRALTAEPKP